MRSRSPKTVILRYASQRTESSQGAPSTTYASFAPEVQLPSAAPTDASWDSATWEPAGWDVASPAPVMLGATVDSAPDTHGSPPPTLTAARMGSRREGDIIPSLELPLNVSAPQPQPVKSTAHESSGRAASDATANLAASLSVLRRFSSDVSAQSYFANAQARGLYSNTVEFQEGLPPGFTFTFEPSVNACVLKDHVRRRAYLNVEKGDTVASWAQDFQSKVNRTYTELTGLVPPAPAVPPTHTQPHPAPATAPAAITSLKRSSQSPPQDDVESDGDVFTNKRCFVEPPPSSDSEGDRHFQRYQQRLASSGLRAIASAISSKPRPL